jgi:hypothetical protein
VGRVGSGTTGASRGRAWLGRCRPGRSGSSAGEAVWGGSGVRRGQGGTDQGGWGWAPPVRGRVKRQREEQLMVAARGAIQRVEEMREREKRGKERVGPGILAYVCRADTSADKRKRAGLRGGYGTLCSLATRQT